MDDIEIDEQMYRMVFGRVLGGLRQHEGWTQVQFAREIGMSQPTLSRIERGLVLPNVYDFKVMAQALDMTIGDFDDAVDEALERTLNAARGIVDEEDHAEGGLLAGLLPAVGAAAVAGLVGFAVAALINERED